MNEQRIKELKKIALEARKQIIIGVSSAKSGHPGGSLSIIDVLTYLYFEKMNVDPKNPQMPERDRFVLSKGHAAPALYSVLALKGFFPVDEIKKLRKPNSILQGHPDKKHIPGVDMSAGSLGQGISAAAGMALSAKHFGDNYRVYCAVGDGESEEGQVWEAAMFAASKKLNNLTVFVDYNNLQIDGNLEQVNSPLPFDKKYEAFNWNVITINGHDFNEIEAAVTEAENCTDKPTAIICKTVKGKGVSYMEDKVEWHGSAPNEELTAVALAELDAQLAELN